MSERYGPNYDRRGHFRGRDSELMRGQITLLYLTTAAVLGLLVCSDQFIQPPPNRKTSNLEPVPYNPGKAHIETIVGITIDHRDGGFLLSRPVLGTQVIDPASR